MEEILTVLNPAQLVTLGVISVGVTELYGRAAAKDWYVVGKIVVAVLTGTLIGLSFGLEFVSALAIGFAPSGGMAVIGSVGNKSRAAPSDLTAKKPQ